MNDTPGHPELAQSAGPAVETQGVAAPATDARATGQATWYPLDPAYIRAEQVGGLIFFAVVFVSALTGVLVKLLFGGIDWLWFLIAGGSGLLLLILLWAALFWPGMEYRRIRWRLTGVGLEIRKGVWWRHRISVPLARVQHADVSQGPLQRSFGLGTLTVHTAGSQSASVDLGGLNHAVALDLRDRLVRQRSQPKTVPPGHAQTHRPLSSAGVNQMTSDQPVTGDNADT